MIGFTFRNPTRILFGADVEDKVGQELLPWTKKVLLHIGGGSVKASGLLDRVTASLAASGIEWVLLEGVKPNPRLSLVHEGVRLCREHGLNFILAVGGGSVIDSAKAIALGVPYDGDVWDFYCGKASPAGALPVGTVLTIPAAGSEASDSSVITNEDGWFKKGYSSDFIYPAVSFLNPERCFTLPAFQVACGVSDMFAHLMERYFTNVKHVELTDRLIEATMKTIIHNGPKLLKNPKDLDAWSEIMWSGTIAHNNMLNTGRIGDWASHEIEHELSGIYDVAHGAGLSVVFSAWFRYTMAHDVERFSQFAQRVFNVDPLAGTELETAKEGLKELVRFYRVMGLPVTLAELGAGDDRLEEMADKCTDGDSRTVGQFVKLGKKDVLHILELARTAP